MTKIINYETNKEAEVRINDKSDLIKKCEEVGVIFGCTDGKCGSCRVEIVEGMENLTERTDEEKDLLTDDKYRLMCQCKIKSGIVKIKI